VKKFWSFKNADEGIGELMLYGDISDFSWWGDEVTPKQFKKDLDDLGDISQLNVYINSSGGDVFAGQAIYTMIRRHKASVTVYVDGLAASIASVIAMAGDKVIMAKGSMMMVHNPWTIAIGNASEFRKIADDMDKITDSVIIPAYERSGQEVDEIKALLDAETWLSDQEAVDLGFADEIEETKMMAASVSEKFYDRFKNMPDGLVKPDADSNETLDKPADPKLEDKNTEANKLMAEIELLTIL
jgi:ATP-dependent Clp protease protease subunit